MYSCTYLSFDHYIYPKKYNVKIVISEVNAFLYGSLLPLGYKVNKRRMSKLDTGFIFRIQINEIFLL